MPGQALSVPYVYVRMFSAIGWVRLSTGWLIFDERYDIIVFCYPNQIFATVQKHQLTDDNRRVSKVRTFKVTVLISYTGGR